jgi:hypothetical protein
MAPPMNNGQSTMGGPAIGEVQVGDLLHLPRMLRILNIP